MLKQPRQKRPLPRQRKRIRQRLREKPLLKLTRVRSNSLFGVLREKERRAGQAADIY